MTLYKVASGRFGVTAAYLRSAALSLLQAAASYEHVCICI